MRKRMAGNWLDTYMQYTEQLESPDHYHLWTGISVLGSAVRRNVYIDQGHYLLFPNLYIILVGESGKVGKSTTIRAGRKLLLNVQDIVFGPDSGSREDLIQFMAKIGGVGQISAVTLHSSEFSSIVETSGLAMIQFLTDIYDCEWNPRGWKHSTKTQGKDVIHNPVVNMLAGTTPSWLGDSMPVKVTEHGFSARTIHVFADKPRLLNPRPRTPSDKIVYALSDDLQHISTLKGPFRLTDEAWAVYDKYYRTVGESDPVDYRLAGYHWRKAKVHLLKAAMIMSISYKDDLVIEAEDIQKGWDALGSIEEDMPRAFASVGKNELASEQERIAQDIINRPEGVSQNDLYHSNRSVGNEEQLDQIMKMILRSEKVASFRKKGKTYFVPARKSKD